MSNIKEVAIKGSVWTTISTLVNFLAQFIRVAILTRFLEKSDFGLVSIVNTFIAMCYIFTDLGFASVIMYKNKLSKIEFSSLFWSQLVIYVFIYLLISFSSPWISSFYSEPDLSVLIPIASISILFQALGKLYDSVLQKNYQFKVLAIRNIVANFISLIIAVVLAMKGFGVYSLIYSTLASLAIINILNLVSGIHIQPIAFILNFRIVTPLIKIGLYQTGTRIFDFISNKLDVFLIGKMLGTEVLGVYDLAKNLVMTLVDTIRGVATKVALPILANSNTDESLIRHRFLVITKIVAVICIPIVAMISIFSKEVLYVIYGPLYVEAYRIVIIFALVSLLNAMCSYFDMLGISKGRTDLNFKNTVYRVIINTAIVYITCHFNIEIVAWGQLAATIITSIIIWRVVVRGTYPLPFRQYYSQFNKILFASVITSIIYISVNVLVFSNWGSNFYLLMSLKIMFALCVSLVCLFIFDKEDITYLISFLKKK